MAFELDENEDAATNIRRIVRERVDIALDCLAGAHGRGEGERVHTARKRFKEIRAALRLIRGAVDARFFRTENRTYRDAARPLSEVRDAQALVEALDALVKHFRDELEERAFQQVRKLLVERRRAIRHAVIVERGALRDVQRTLRAARRRIDGWPLRGLEFGDFVEGIAKTYRTARRAMAVANDVETDECLHEWRKQGKYLRHQAEILRSIWPPAMDIVAEQSHELADVLGDDHDLVVMEHVVTVEERGSVDTRERKALVGLIHERRSTFRKQSKELGRKLFAEKPKAFRRRVGIYLDAWA
jgi:CHAD domain-containing protein